MSWEPDDHHPLRGVCTAWMGKVRKAEKFKKPWQEIADECESFYSACTGFMFDPAYKNKFWDVNRGEVQPRFRLTIARAFELVALFGPALYWRNPLRTAEVRQLPEIGPEAFGMTPDAMQALQAVQGMQQYQQQAQMALQQGQQPPPPPQIQPPNPQLVQMALQAQAMFQQAQQEYQQEVPARQARAELMQRYLNWTPNILGLHRDAELAVTQALVTGRGCLWTLPYQPPGSDKIMVGSFFDPVENLLIDPDAESLETAWWIARKCTEPVWKVERDRGMPADSLKRYASYVSVNAQGEADADDMAYQHEATGQSQDLLTYYKVWSRCGLARLKELKTDLKEQIEKATGDYCYIEVASQCPFPLNAPTARLENMTMEEATKAFRWPTPFWRRDRWPVQVLDFYSRPKKAWPIAPLAPGLGELKALQVLFSHLVSKIWMTQRDFIVYSKAATEEVRKILEEGRDLSFLPLDTIHNSVNDVIQFLQHPPVNRDAFYIMEQLMEMFDRRTGLTDLVYGVQQLQSRSATDVRIRQSATSVRPQFMASKVEEWQSQIAKAEAFAVRWYVQGQDVMEVLGKSGAMLWDRLIVQSDVERTVDEIDYKVEAASAMRPNLERDTENIGQFIQTFGPILHQVGATTGNFTPLNNLMKTWGKAVQMDVNAFMIPAPPPPPPNSDQQQLQLEQQKAQMDVQVKQQEAALRQQQDQQAMVLEQQRAQQQMIQDQQRHELEMQRLFQRGQLETQLQAVETQQARKAGEQDLEFQRKKAAAAQRAQAQAASRNGGGTRK